MILENPRDHFRFESLSGPVRGFLSFSGSETLSAFEQRLLPANNQRRNGGQISGLKKPDISILSDEFLAEVKGMSRLNVAFELLRKLLTNEIKVRSRKFLIQSRSFAELLEETLRKFQNRAIETAQVVEELIRLAKEIQEAGRAMLGKRSFWWAFGSLVLVWLSSQKEFRFLFE